MTDSSLNQFVARGTSTARVAFTPTPPLSSSGYFWYETDTGSTYAWNGSAWAVVSSGAASAITLISEVVTAGTQTSVTFSSIPATFRDLLIMVRGRSTTTAISDSVILQFNGDTTAGNYLYENLQGSNATVTSGATTSAAFIYVGEIPAASATANFAGINEIRVPDYHGTTFFKDTLSRSGAQANTNLLTQQLWGAWKSTAAITAAKVFLNGAGGFVNGSVVSLYGSL